MPVRNLHVSRYVHVGSNGGTERYLLDLVQAMSSFGHESSIAWLCNEYDGDEPFQDRYGFTIVPFAVPPGYVDKPPSTLKERFRDWLLKHPVDVVHFHTFSLSEAALGEVACSQGIPYIFTYHSPAWSCRRGDLLKWGEKICDGEVRSWRCSACMIQQRLQTPVLMSWALTGILTPLGLAGRFAGGKVHRRTAFIEDTARFRTALRTFLKNAAKIVACSEWSIPVLARNSAPSNRIIHSPQGVPMDFVQAVAEISVGRTQERKSFTVGYVGRVTPVKGIHILVEAFVKTGYSHARLRIYGCSDSEVEDPYLQRLRKLAGSDPRVEFIPKLPFEAMLREYRKLDLLAIPSIWLETGPLTLLEALALGLEVWGSETIGQIHLLQEYGQVIRPNIVSAWQGALEKAFERYVAGKRRDAGSNTATIRTMQDVANEMVDIYDEISLIDDGL